MITHGYSGTPLVKKLGIKPGARILVRHAPDDYEAIVGELPDGVSFENDGAVCVDFIHIFVHHAAEIPIELDFARRSVAPDGMIWISWYKKASKIPTDVTEDVIRAVARAGELVDVKVCAVDAIWSGLKLVIRKEFR